MSPIFEDLRFSLRVMRRSPGLTFVAVLTLSLGIAANTTIFGWVDSILLEPVRGVGNGSTLHVMETMSSGGPPENHMSFRDYQDYRDHLRSISGLALAKHAILSIGPEGDARRTWGEVVSSNYFEVLQVKAQVGRTFDSSKHYDAPGSLPAVVISDRLWRTRYNADPAIVGKTIHVNRHELRVEGVAPREFQGSLSALHYDVWVPFCMEPQLGIGGSLTWRATRDGTATFVRLRDSVRLSDARQEAAMLAGVLAAGEPVTNRGVSVTILPLLQGHGGGQGLLRGALTILMVACALLLLIVCGNVANLLLAQSVSRQKEFGVRLAMGAGRGDLIRLLFAHSFLLSLLGSAGAVLAAVWMYAGLDLLLPVAGDVPIELRSLVNPVALAFTALLCIVATVVSGIAPALVCSHANLRDTLNDAGRGGGAGRRAKRIRGALVTAEITLATVALVGAGLCLQSFRNATRINPGFNANNVTLSQYFLAGIGYKTADEVRFMHDVRERLRAVPGIAAVAYSEQIPLHFGLTPVHQMEPEGYTGHPGETLYINRMQVSPGWFDLLQMPLLEGRDFRETDTRKSERVIIVNQTFVERFFGGRNALGRKVRVERNMCTVVGVVRNAKYHSSTEAPIPYAYLPFDQTFSTGLVPTMFVRSEPGAMALAEDALRREARTVEPDASVFNLAPLSEHMASSLYAQRVAATLLVLLGGACLLLAGIGLYGVISYAVGQRSHEIGVRLALGAGPARIAAMVMRDAIAVSLPGAVAGMVISIAFGPKLGALLVDVTAADPVILGAVWTFLTVTSLLASYVPAHRAARMQPMSSMRAE